MNLRLELFGAGLRKGLKRRTPADQAALDAAEAKRARRRQRNLRLVEAGGFR